MFSLCFVPGVTPGKWLRVWSERRPDRPADARPAERDEALAALADGSAHMAFVRLPVDDDSLHVIPLYEENTVVVAPREHVIEAAETVELADLADETVLPGEGADTVELVAANVGVALMPQSVARAHSRRDTVHRVVTDAPRSRMALVWRRDLDDEGVEEFVGIVRGRTANSSRNATPERSPEQRASGAPRSTGGRKGGADPAKGRRGGARPSARGRRGRR